MKHIPLCKQSKAAQREYYLQQRGGWHGVNPVTRSVPNGKAYNRAKAKREERASCQ